MEPLYPILFLDALMGKMRHEGKDIARALAGQPEVLLADEPTSNLDLATAAELLAALREAHAAGKTVVLSSHDPRVIALATQVYELEGGKRKSVGQPSASH